MVLILALSMVAYVVNGVTGLANNFDMLSQQKSVVTFKDVAYFPEFSIETLGSQINIINQTGCWCRLCSHLDWHSQTVISLYQEVGEGQVLDGHGCCHGILSYLISA